MISTRSVELVIDTVVCLTLAKWETVSGQFGGYLRFRKNADAQPMFAPQSTTNSTPRSKPAQSWSPLRKTSVRGEAFTRGVVLERVDIEQPVRTLVLGLLKLGWTQHSNRFRSALDDFGSVA